MKCQEGFGIGLEDFRHTLKSNLNQHFEKKAKAKPALFITISHLQCIVPNVVNANKTKTQKVGRHPQTYTLNKLIIGRCMMTSCQSSMRDSCSWLRWWPQTRNLSFHSSALEICPVALKSSPVHHQLTSFYVAGVCLHPVSLVAHS